MATTSPPNATGGPREARDRGATGAAVRAPCTRTPALVALTGAGPDVRN
ncbi:hypothetical protein ACFC0C_17225 [Streptomyces sp. NPDC056178]